MESPDRPRTHWLRKNDANAIPTQLIFVAVEPRRYRDPGAEHVEIHHLGIGHACSVRLENGEPCKREWLTFYTAAQFWDWAAKRLTNKRPVWIVTHNLDYVLTLLQLWEQLENQNLTFRPLAYTDSRGKIRYTKPGLLVDGEHAKIVSVRSEHGRIYAVDTQNYWSIDLAALGNHFGVTRRPRPGDAAEVGDWEDFVKRDVEILYTATTALMGWWHRGDHGNWGFTAPSLAMHNFRHRYMRAKELLVHDHAAALDLERHACVGGETRVFFAGSVAPEGARGSGRLYELAADQDGRKSGPVYCLDVSSLYPSVMAEHLYPTELLAYKADGCLDDITQWSRFLSVVARVQIESRDSTYPWTSDGQQGRSLDRALLREKVPGNRAGNERYYALGRYWTTLCGPELLRAVKAGHVRAVGPVASYKWGRPFTKFVHHWWRVRHPADGVADPVNALFAKMLLNSLYGRFAMTSPAWVDRPNFASPQPFGYIRQRDQTTGAITKFRIIGWLAQEHVGREESSQSMPAIAAFVASYARERMRALRQIAHEDEIYYQDTDSIHCTHSGYCRLLAAGEVAQCELGKLRLERVVATAEYRGIKDYTHDGMHTVAGLKSSALEVAPGRWTQDKSEGIMGVVGRGPDGTVRVTQETFAVAAKHVRGRMEASGRVLPAVIWDGEIIDRPLAALPWDAPYRHKSRTSDAD